MVDVEKAKNCHICNGSGWYWASVRSVWNYGQITGSSSKPCPNCNSQLHEQFRESAKEAFEQGRKENKKDD